VGGIPCPLPRVILQVRDRYGVLVALPFRIDTGADFTAVPLALARRQGIPFRETLPGVARGLVGAVEKYRAEIQLVVAGKEHLWPCDFIKEALPAEGLSLSASVLAQEAVLGRAGFLDEYALSLDSGYLILTRLGTVRRWLRRRLHSLWEWWGGIHPLDRPL